MVLNNCKIDTNRNVEWCTRTTHVPHVCNQYSFGAPASGVQNGSALDEIKC